jgi:hypothetical protein
MVPSPVVITAMSKDIAPSPITILAMTQML